MAQGRDKGGAGRAPTGSAGSAGDVGTKSVWRPSEVTARRGVEVHLAPDDIARAALAADLGILAIPDLRLVGRLAPEGRQDFRLDAHLRAVVEQECVVTLDPVRSVIDEPVIRRFLADMPEPAGDEVEMPGDDSAEPLGAAIDLNAVLHEALALALPPWPRAPSALAAEVEVGARGANDAVTQGIGPGDGDRQRPFAGLSALLGKARDGS